MIKEELKNLDVLHLGYRFDLGYSISKIVSNVILNAKEVRQEKINLKRFQNEEDTINLINQIQPKILHLHFSSLFNEELFSKLNYRPYIICTVHGLTESPYRDYVDLLICIHEGAYHMNKGKRIIIENTIDIEGKNKIENIEGDIEFCCSCRYAKEAISPLTIRTFSSVNSIFHIYGYDKRNKISRQIYKHISKYSNLVPHEWSLDVESSIIKHPVYAYIKPVINPDICQGMNVMEAVSLGIPCITTHKKQNFQKYVIDGYNGFMVDDRIEFIKKCNYLVRNKDAFEEIRKNALEHSNTIENIMPQEYQNIYLEVLKNG